MKLFVKTKPNSRKEETKQIDPTHFEVKIRALAKEGKANSAVISAISKHVGLAKSRIKIISGEKSKEKILEIN